MANPVNLFYCYARTDEKWLRMLQDRLIQLERDGKIKAWYDGEIKAGSDWEHELLNHLDMADLILLLVTPNFIASEYGYNKEMKLALEAHEAGLTIVVPILISPSGWENTSLKDIQALPRNGRPVTQWKNRDEVWQLIAQEIRSRVDEQFDLINRQGSHQKRTLAYLQRVHTEAHTNPYLLDFLKWRYGKKWQEEEKIPIPPLLERGGQTFPVIVYHAPKEQMRDLDSCLLRPLASESPQMDEKLVFDSLRKLREQALPREALPDSFQNKKTFVMKQFTTGQQLLFECASGYYFDAMDTCESLEWEILRNACHHLREEDLNGKSHEEVIKVFEGFNDEDKLTQRVRFHEMVTDPIGDGDRRSVALSISTLVAYKRKGKFYVWLQYRTSKVATHPEFLHLIPSFIFQPEFRNYEEDQFSIRYNVEREYLEEIFGYKFDDHQDPDFVDEMPELQYLRSLLSAPMDPSNPDGPKKAELYFSGVAVSPLNFRHEICTVLLIRSEEWYEYHHNGKDFKLNFEWLEEVSGKRYASYIPLPSLEIEDDKADALLMASLKDAYDRYAREVKKEAPKENIPIAPVGAGSFWLGIDLLRRIFKDESM